MLRSGATVPSPDQAARVDLPALEEIQRRVLWLATRIVDHANRDRVSSDGIKVGGHQASTASSISIMTALWFAFLDPADRVSVKPHASPGLHAIAYLLGHLDRSYLTRLRELGGLQSYPSRTKDPDRVDFSTGSVGLGAAAPLFGAVARRYVDAHFGPRPVSRFIAHIGDAELDEGNVWEAVADPATSGLGNVMWVVDFNRQSLDRVVPGVRIAQWRAQFEAAGWHVVEVKHGRRIAEALTRSGGDALRRWFDEISNEQYQSLFSLSGGAFRERFLLGAPSGVTAFCADIPDEELVAIVTDLGGHDLAALLNGFRAADAVTDRPSVVFCYTVKGWGLPIAGNPRNHSALLGSEDIDALRDRLGIDPRDEWAALDPSTPGGALAAERGRLLTLPDRPDQRLEVNLPTDVGAVQGSRPISSQEVFGRTLTALSRHEEVGRLLVTTAPDVATTTNLAGFIARTGAFAPIARHSWHDDRMVEWSEGPEGQHIELGISEMNFFMLLGQLGLTWDLSGQALLPVGTVYDPFVLRGLDALIYSVYSGARFVLAGTPSGVTLAPEGGAHQSTVTPSVGIGLPHLQLMEPAFARAVEWLLLDALQRIARNPSGRLPDDPESERKDAYYFRLSTRPIDQSPFEDLRARLGDAVLRRQVLAGAYRLVDGTGTVGPGAPVVNLAVLGPLVGETLEAAAMLSSEGVEAHVIEITSPSRIYDAWQRSIRRAVRTGRTRAMPGEVHHPFVPGAPVVTVHDASSHALAWLGSALGVPAVPLGVDAFGQSGTIGDLYRINDLAPEAIVNAALTSLAG